MNFNNRLTKAPELQFCKEWECWMLSLRESADRISINTPLDVNASYSMLIRTGWDGKSQFQYSFIRFEFDGNWTQLNTKTEYASRVKAIRENEGDEITSLWEEFQDQYEAVRDDHIIFALRPYWEALMLLNVITVNVTHSAKVPFKEFSSELKAQMDAIRDRDLKASMEVAANATQLAPEDGGGPRASA